MYEGGTGSAQDLKQGYNEGEYSPRCHALPEAGPSIM